MKLIKGVILGSGWLMGMLLSTQTIACTPGQGPAGDPNCRGAIESSGWYGDNGGGDAPAYRPPKVIILPDSWGAIAVGSGSMGVASKQASKQASRPTKLCIYGLYGLQDIYVVQKYLCGARTKFNNG